MVGDSHAPRLVPVSISVNLRGCKGWRAGAHHGHIVPYQEDAQALAQVAHELASLSAHVPGELPA